MENLIKIHEKDNIVIGIKDLEIGFEIFPGVKLKENIEKGHKIAIENIKKGENIIKYGYPIGHATENIQMGEFVHSHNLKTNLAGVEEYVFDQSLNPLNMEDKNLSFKGYKRKNGDVGIRNELWIVPTVGCANGIGEQIIQEFKKKVDTSKIDGIHIFKHDYGCSQLGEDHKNTRTILANMTKHANAGGVLILGLGCENNNIEEFKKNLNQYDSDRVKFLVSQDVRDEVQAGVEILKELYDNMLEDKREAASISKLKIGLKCGGSDGFSGITANPLLGELSDFIVSQGGSSILTEVPEMFGAETQLMSRAKDEDVFRDIVHLINNFKEYFIQHDQPIYENPSPGNKAGGITTLEEKSLGCTEKGGMATIVDVLDYGEIISKKGLNLLNSPGNDLVSSTALGASGCQMVLFTTGRGTPFSTFVPTVKISTNSDLYNNKPHWIDFNAGKLLEGYSMEEVLEDLTQYILEVASGERVNSEIGNFKEIAIFKTGVTL